MNDPLGFGAFVLIKYATGPLQVWFPAGTPLARPIYYRLAEGYGHQARHPAA